MPGLLHRLLASVRNLCEDQEVGGALYAIGGIGGASYGRLAGANAVGGKGAGVAKWQTHRT